MTQPAQSTSATNGSGSGTSTAAVTPTAVPAPAVKVAFSTNCHPDIELDNDFVELIKELEAALKREVWLLVNGQHLNGIEAATWTSFFKVRENISKNIALVIHSPGGDAKAAFQISKLLQNKSEYKFMAVVPLYAKSAATLLSFGARNILMGAHAELGPLDAQLYDPDREEVNSALDEVQSLERLNASALQALDQVMLLMTGRTKKKILTLMPYMIEFATKIMNPVFSKIDTVHYTQMSRILKVAEEYATRLLKPHFGTQAQSIARHFVERYPEHGFVIDPNEAREIGLKNVSSPSGDIGVIVEKLASYLNENDVCAIGKIEVMP